jgi:hypothetical protein
MKVFALLSFTAFGVGLLLCGCGGGSVPPAPVSPLGGNWLIVGPMPTDQLQFPPVTEGFSLAMTFDVTGNNIAALGYAIMPCQPASSSPPPILVPVSVSSEISLNGTAAADGSFSLQTPANFPVGSMSIQGRASRTNDGEWPGSYTVSLNPTFGPPCTGSFAGTFTATSFPLIDGVYVGTGSLLTSVNHTGTPVTVQMTLKQGGTVVDQVTGKPFSSNLALTGSVRIQGAPCFTSGTMNPYPQSAVEGNQVVASFSMDDGSTLRIVGTLTDSTEIRMTSRFLVTAEQCGTVPYSFQLRELDRQS